MKTFAFPLIWVFMLLGLNSNAQGVLPGDPSGMGINTANNVFINVPAGKSMEIEITKDAGSMQRILVYQVLESNPKGGWSEVFRQDYKGNVTKTEHSFAAVGDAYIWRFAAFYTASVKDHHAHKFFMNTERIKIIGFDDSKDHTRDYNDLIVTIFFKDE